MIIAKIDVTKIDKTKLFKGAKGTYLDIVLIDTPNGQYGDYMVCQGVSKEDRAAGVKGAILGNGKKFEGRGGSKPAPKTQPKARPEPDGDDGDDVPF